MRPDCRLDHTVISATPDIQPRSFPQQHKFDFYPLLPFTVSSGNNAFKDAPSSILSTTPKIPSNNSRQATLYTAVWPHDRFIPRQVRRLICAPPERASTTAGSALACRCKSPDNLNPQHQPQSGRKKPTPETSSICPSTDF